MSRFRAFSLRIASAGKNTAYGKSHAACLPVHESPSLRFVTGQRVSETRCRERHTACYVALPHTKPELISYSLAHAAST